MTDAEKKYDDYEGLDVAGRVVIVLRGVPPQLKSDPAPRERALFDKKIERAVELDAAAILFVNTTPESDVTEKLLPFGRRSRVADVPLVHVSRSMTDEVLTAAGLPALKTLQESIDKGEKASQVVPGVSISGSVAVEKVVWPSRNVIGLVRGNGPQADEYVVIGAHYDHLGIQDGKIHNGADDNASGTAAVVEICEAIAGLPNRNRSLLCMAFTGEEIGLLGSEHYAAHSTVPIQSIIAMINLDMIGRWTPGIEENELAIQGLGTGDSFQLVVDRHVQPEGIKYIPDPSASGPSDHASFYEAKVPSLFFFTGVHEDYHRPGDDVEKINAKGAAQIATLVGNVTLDLLTGEQRPKYIEVDKQARIFRGPPPSPVVMGILPDPEQDSSKPGWLIGEVVPTGGAAKGGMKSGDRILSLDGSPIKKMSDYYKATANKKAGDVVSVVVRRGTEDVTLQIELAARGGS
ncbi:MAG: M28 family peptidase [Planctomycetaceae bacterium]